MTRTNKIYLIEKAKNSIKRAVYNLSRKGEQKYNYHVSLIPPNRKMEAN